MMRSVLARTGAAFGTIVSMGVASAQTTPANWTERVTLKGDLRIRTEMSVLDGAPSARWRNRMQARIGLSGKINDSVNAQFRLATAESAANSITSSNQTFDNSSTKKEIWYDLAFVDWKAADTVNVGLGKMANPFWIAGKQQLIWDSDVTFEGGSVKYAQDLAGLQLMFNGGGFWLDERFTATGAGTGPDIFLTGAQLGAGLKTEIVNSTLAVAYYSASNVKNTNLPTGTGNVGLLGNTAAANGGYAYNFGMLDVGLEVGTDALGIPLLAYGDWVQNGDPSRNNDGWAVGARIGKLTDIYTWSIDYTYRDIDSDSVIGGFNDADFGGGGTAQYGSRVNLQFQAAEGIVTAFTYSNAHREGARAAADGDFEERSQLDFTFAF